jgi:hypothetical protein
VPHFAHRHLDSLTAVAQVPALPLDVWDPSLYKEPPLRIDLECWICFHLVPRLINRILLVLAPGCTSS